MYKHGFPESHGEAVHCQVLGPDVAPVVLNITQNGYYMEKLRQAPFTPDLPKRILLTLREHVWQRPPIRNGPPEHGTWVSNFVTRFQMQVPEWARPHWYCLCHGDPAVGNALLRGEQLILADPCAPRDYLPETAALDAGKVLQSILGWEEAAYGVTLPYWDIPEFSKAEAFWAMVSAMRVLRREVMHTPRPRIVKWCDTVITGLRNELNV